ncbi:MAG: ABC-type spermidine/putrescine transport system, permease component I [Halonotius sp. J07HN6]|nr:MAG: ABC-type spermidine/putrescine transport system, permease component I [Halonotius sp. J07HN6]ERH05069.1 MAG: ABC-type spermidine/putrescine transport system, permease component I [Halonotius sp. J07HN4]
MGSADEHHRLRDGVIAGIPVSVAVAVGVLPMVVLFVESIGPGLSTANYGEVVGPLYRGTLLYSLGVGVAVTAICLSIAYPVTYWVAHRCPKRYRLGLLVALTLPLWLNYVVLNYSWVWILARGGLLNHILTAVGLVGEPLDLLYTDVSMGIGFVYIYLPYVILTLYVSMERLDYRLIEAARDLGATNRRVFLDVILPSTLPGATAAALIVYARIAGAFATPAILGGPGNVMIASLIAEAFRQYFDYGFAAALSFAFLAVVVVALLAGAAIPQVREELRQW